MIQQQPTNSPVLSQQQYHGLGGEVARAHLAGTKLGKLTHVLDRQYLLLVHLFQTIKDHVLVKVGQVGLLLLLGLLL